jgi:hypothetical protein
MVVCFARYRSTPTKKMRFSEDLRCIDILKCVPHVHDSHGFQRFYFHMDVMFSRFQFFSSSWTYFIFPVSLSHYPLERGARVTNFITFLRFHISPSPFFNVIIKFFHKKFAIWCFKDIFGP